MRYDIEKIHDGFKERMMVPAVSSIFTDKRKISDSIPLLNNDRDLISNVAMDILNFARYSELAGEPTRTMDDFADFLQNDLNDSFHITCTFEEAKTIAEYLIVQVFQGDGHPPVRKALNPANGKLEEIPIMIFREKYIDGTDDISYSLTDMGWDYVFKTFDIAEEFDFDVEQMILRQKCKSGAYKEASAQAVRILRSVLKVKSEIETLMDMMDKDITTVSSDLRKQHVEMVTNVFSENRKYMNVLLDDVVGQREAIDEQLRDTGKLDLSAAKKLVESRNDIAETEGTIIHIIAAADDVLQKKIEMNNKYRELLVESLRVPYIERFNFERVVLTPLQSCHSLLPVLADLLSSLCFPACKKTMNFEMLYAPQKKPAELETDGKPVDEYSEEESRRNMEREENKLQAENDAYTHILDTILQLLSSTAENHVTLQQVYDALDRNIMEKESLNPRLFYYTILEMYRGYPFDFTLDYRKKKIKTEIHEYSKLHTILHLEKMHPDFYGIKTIHIYKDDTAEPLCTDDGKKKRTMDSLIFVKDEPILEQEKDTFSKEIESE